MAAPDLAPPETGRPAAGATPPTGPAGPAGKAATTEKILTATVIVSALGYFVDIYDLLLFSIVRVPSLVALGVPQDQLLDQGVFLLNVQMAGLLTGGILWGILADKRGRLSVLFGSIALYSVANIANAFVTNVPQYAALRFVAGVGLAGELGAAITLVSETMSKETRGYGTAIVAGVGILGAVVAALVGALFDWQTAFIVGGLLGLGLLVARIAVAESGMWKAAKKDDGVRRGSLLLLVGNRERASRYFWSVAVGAPIWFVIGILITFSPEFSRALGVTGAIAAGTAVAACYAGAAAGDLVSGFASQRFRSRRWTMLIFLQLTAVSMFAYLFLRGLSPAAFYGLCAVLGFGAGYWAVFVTNAAEQFGTNLRGTATTMTPNLIRGSVVPLTIAFLALRSGFGILGAALIVGSGTLLLALLALRMLPETWGKDLDYVET